MNLRNVKQGQIWLTKQPKNRLIKIITAENGKIEFYDFGYRILYIANIEEFKMIAKRKLNLKEKE